MNRSAIATLISLRPLRQWLARCLRYAWHQPATSAPHIGTPPREGIPLSSPACARPKAARTPHAHSLNGNTVNSHIIPFRARRGDIAHQLFLSSAHNTPDTESDSVCLHNLEEMLATRWYTSQDLVTLDKNTLIAFETAFPAEKDFGNISMKQRQAALVRFKALLLERKQAIQELLAQDDALIPALAMLGIEMPEAIPQQEKMPPPSQG